MYRKSHYKSAVPCPAWQAGATCYENTLRNSLTTVLSCWRSCVAHIAMLLLLPTHSYLTQESGKRKLDDTGADKISADDLVSEEQQAKRRERFLTQEQKEAAAAKEEEAKRKAERVSRFHPDEAKKVDRSQRFQQWLGSNPTTAAPAAASAANGKPAGDKITAAVNSSLDQSAKLLGKGPKGKGGSGKGASIKSAAAAPAETKYSDEFKAKADVSLLHVSWVHQYCKAGIVAGSASWQLTAVAAFLPAVPAADVTDVCARTRGHPLVKSQ